jgi:hypothetical protein
MKAYKVKYLNGHFIDQETNQRLIPIQNVEYFITAADDAFESVDVKLQLKEILNAKQKEEWALNEYGLNTLKLLEANAKLAFRIGNSKRVKGEESMQYIFVCTLLEDLYLYALSGKSENVYTHWRLADCKCQLEKCIRGGLTLSEKVTANSLNELFSNTVQFYFSLQRSSSANVFNTFFDYHEKMDPLFDGASNGAYNTLAKQREAAVQKHVAKKHQVINI